MRSFALFVLIVCGLSLSAWPQPHTTSLSAADKADVIAFRTFFRRALLYKDLSDKADAAHTSKPELKRILLVRFSLSDSDNANLERLALAYQNEIIPIHLQVLAIADTFHGQLEERTPGKSLDHTVPAELNQLQMQEDTITLRYRDLFRNSMREQDFEKSHAEILESFGKSLTVK